MATASRTAAAIATHQRLGTTTKRRRLLQLPVAIEAGMGRAIGVEVTTKTQNTATIIHHTQISLLLFVCFIIF
jgi:hypothetical protein